MTVADIVKMHGGQRAPAIEMFWPHSHPNLQMQPRVSAVRIAISAFNRNGRTTHSPNAQILPYIVAYCEENAIGYSLQAFFYEGRGTGYYIEKHTRGVASYELVEHPIPV